MGNIVMLREPLTFGKHEGLTGAELMKSEKGTQYLKWIYNNTDIKIEDCIVNQLIGHGIIIALPARHNSRGQTSGADISAVVDAAAHDAYHKVRTDSIKDICIEPGKHGLANCPVCNRIFTKKNYDHKYCQKSCSREAADKRKLQRELYGSSLNSLTALLGKQVRVNLNPPDATTGQRHENNYAQLFGRALRKEIKSLDADIDMQDDYDAFDHFVGDTW